MAREVALEEMPPSSQPSIDPPSTPQTEDGAPSVFKDEMPPLEVIEAQAQELESMTPSRPSLPQTSLMEFIFAWLTPFPDDPWLNMIATCMQWPPSWVDKWFRFRRGIAVRAAKKQRQHHPFRKPHELLPVEVDGRTVEMRCAAVQDGTVWSDEYFYLLVAARWKFINTKWGKRCEQMEYEAELMREYCEQVARGELSP